MLITLELEWLVWVRIPDKNKLFLDIAEENKLYLLRNIILNSAAASKYGVFVVCIFPHSVQSWDNMDQKNCVLGHS